MTAIDREKLDGTPDKEKGLYGVIVGSRPKVASISLKIPFPMKL